MRHSYHRNVVGISLASARDYAISSSRDIPLRQLTDHSRSWRENYYVYPVVSRRSGGLSIGVNLNPDAACNFDCIYCQVDRTVSPRIREVDVDVLGDELAAMFDLAQSGALFQEIEFAGVPAGLQCIRDVAFSGDGEPTTCVHFAEVVQRTASLLRTRSLADVKVVLITDACYLTRPHVVAGLEIMDRNNGEIWAKLDAGTEDYYRLVNRPNYPLHHVIENIIATACVRPVVIQSMFMRIDGAAPSASEVSAYLDRLKVITNAGGVIKLVQVYTVARRPAQPNVSPMSDAEVDDIVARVVAETGLRALPYYGPP